MGDCTLRKLLWKHVTELIMIGLASQVTLVQAYGTDALQQNAKIGIGLESQSHLIDLLKKLNPSFTGTDATQRYSAYGINVASQSNLLDTLKRVNQTFSNAITMDFEAVAPPIDWSSILVNKSAQDRVTHESQNYIHNANVFILPFGISSNGSKVDQDKGTEHELQQIILQQKILLQEILKQKILLREILQQKKLHLDASSNVNNMDTKEPVIDPTLNDLNCKDNNTIAAWSYKIHNNDYQEIIEFAKKYKDVFNNNLDQLIQKVYARDLKNAETIIKFIRYLPDISNAAIACTSLFEKMKDNGSLDSYQLLTLAYTVKQFMGRRDYDYASQYYKDKFTTLKNNLPNSIRGLIWNGDDCAIRDARDKEYLYAAYDDLAYDNMRRSVFMWTPGGYDRQCYWNITYDYDRENGTFSIKYKYYNEYLYATVPTAEYNTDAKRFVFTWRGKNQVPQGYWRLIPINSGSFFVIKNTYHVKYLCASDGGKPTDFHSPERRFVLIDDDYDSRRCNWKISC